MTKQVDKARERFQQWSLSNGFTLIKKNANDAYPYYAVRCQNHTMQSTLKRLQTQHPHMQVIFQTQHVPNGVNLFSKLKCGGAKWKGNNYTPANNIETDITKLQAICNFNNKFKIHSLFILSMYSY